MGAINYVPPGSLIPFLTSEKFVALQVGPVGCLHGDSLVLTENGPTPISEIDRPTRVLSWDAKTRQFRLAQASVAFPKGTDCLYRVVTPQGEFDAAGSHLLLCADGEYRRVEELRQGDVLAPYCRTPLQTTEELVQSESRAGGQRSSQTPADCQGGYGVLDRLHGLLALSLKEGVLAFAPSHSGVQTCTLQFAQPGPSQLSDLAAELSARTRSALFDAQQQTGGYSPHRGHLQRGGVDRTSAESCGYVAVAYREAGLFQWTKRLRLQARALAKSVLNLVFPSHTPSLITSDRPILSITRKEVKEIYWDIQVDGTHNYVTVDGAIHHNSTKTTAGIMKIAYMAKQMAKSTDGFRHSRVVWVRRSRQMLFDTSIKDFLSWFPEGQAGDFNKTNAQFILKFDDVVCEVLFRPMEDESDVNRILSLQLSFAVLDEFREISPAVFEALQGRLGRFPDKRMVLPRPEWGDDADGNPIGGCVTDEGKPHKHMWGMTNPPDADTYWEKLLTEPPDNVGAFFQPSGMSPEADWVKYLPSNYYADLAQGKSQDYIDVFIHSKFGRSLSGQPVWRCFDREMNVAKESLKSNAQTLVIGVDAGLNPTAVITEMTYDGRVAVLDAVTGHEGGMGALRFCREILKPLIARKYPNREVAIIIDPAAFQRAQTDERSVADIFRSEHFAVKAALTNNISARLAAVEKYLTLTINGNTGMLIDPECKQLIAAMAGKYRYKINTKGETDDKPDKNHPFSDYADSLQYACLHHDKGSIFGRSMNSGYQEPERVSMSAWT